MIYSINKSNLNTIFIKILTIVIISFKLLLNMENKCAICQDEIFASWHCAHCEGNGPLLCYEHFLNGPCLLDLSQRRIRAWCRRKNFLSEVRKEFKANSFILLQEAKASIIDDLHKAENSQNVRLSINIGFYDGTNEYEMEKMSNL